MRNQVNLQHAQTPQHTRENIMTYTLTEYDFVNGNGLVDTYIITHDNGIEYLVRPKPRGYLAWISYWGETRAYESFSEKDYGSDARAYAAALKWFKKADKLIQSE